MNKALILLAFSLFLFGCAQQYGASPTPVLATPEPSQSAPSPGASPSQAAAGASVEISGFAFEPAELSVSVGTTVTWTNKDAAPHQVVSDSGSELASETLSQGGSYSHVFNAAGTFEYHCAIHPNMTGRIIVS